MNKTREINEGERVVIAELKKAGKEYKMVPNSAGYDIEVGNELIEVKGRTNWNKTKFIMFSKNQQDRFEKNKRNYRVYLVDLKNKRTIKILNKKRLNKMKREDK